MQCVNGHCKPLIPGSTQSSQLCDLQREFIRLQLIDSTFANSSGRQFWWKRYVTLHLGDQGCGLHRAKLPERASIVSEYYYINSTVLITLTPEHVLSAAGTLWQAPGDQTAETEGQRRDRVGNVSLHRCETRAGGSRRVWQVF